MSLPLQQSRWDGSKSTNAGPHAVSSTAQIRERCQSPIRLHYGIDIVVNGTILSYSLLYSDKRQEIASLRTLLLSYYLPILGYQGGSNRRPGGRTISSCISDPCISYLSHAASSPATISVILASNSEWAAAAIRGRHADSCSDGGTASPNGSSVICA
jgi:hypothetical protein